MSEKPLDNSDLDNKYFIDHAVYNCPFCNRRNVIYRLTNTLEFDWSTEKKCYVYTAKCSSCLRESMHLSFDDMLEGGDHSGTITYPRKFAKKLENIDSHIFYSMPTSFFTIDTRIPKIIRELITEAEGSLKMNYLTGASACMRKAIYEFLFYEKLIDGSYEDRVKSLKCKYPSNDPELFDILSHIQQMTSAKVHEQSWDKWDSSTIRLILETMKEILYEIYVLPAERKQRRNTIQQLRQQSLGESNPSKLAEPKIDI